MERSGIEKIAKTPEDRLLLAKLYDKINAGVRKNITANTCFLSPRELELADFLFGNLPGLHRFGGYEDAERKMRSICRIIWKKARFTGRTVRFAVWKPTFLKRTS